MAIVHTKGVICAGVVQYLSGEHERRVQLPARNVNLPPITR